MLILIQVTWELIEKNEAFDNFVNAIYRKHQTANKEAELIKSLEKKRDEALTVSGNLIAAIEQDNGTIRT